ncbi:hypothetical protein HDU67_002664 [Dinochytrium kinnereticum]|nr:hypothetical protein HDU67_002664 [Dinochytrium kinnereticum]
MTYPPIRLLAGDSGNGFTFARTANVQACQGLPRGSSQATITSNSFNVQYVLTAPHKGGCIVYISTNGGSSWTEIGRDNRCGYGSGGSIRATLRQSGTYDAIIRWYYETDNFTGEKYNNCADVRINTSGGGGAPAPRPSPSPSPRPAPSPSPRPRPAPQTPNQGSACRDGQYKCASANAYQICQASRWSVSLGCGNGFKCNAANRATPCVVAK